MTGKTAIYSVTDGQEGGKLSVQQSWESSKEAGGFNAGYNSFCTADVEKQTMLLAMDAKQGSIDIYQVASGGTGLTLKQQNKVTVPYQHLCSFTIARLPHLVAYDPVSGTVDFYRIDASLELAHIYSYRKTYGQVTTGWTTIHAYEYRGTMLLLGYNMENGQVAIYQLQVTATEALTVTETWSAAWAQGWTRFSFFLMGGENFFLKSNIKHKHVFIDHLVDNPDDGSHPVGKDLPLSVDMTAVKTFELDGIIHFAAYLGSSGEASLYRIHVDCQGWSDEGSFTAVTGAEHLVPIRQGESTFLFIY